MILNAEADTSPKSGTIPAGMRQHAEAVKEDLRGLGRATMDAAQDKLTGAGQKASDAADHIEGYIRRKPLKSIMVVAGLSALAGFLLSRR